MINKMQWISPKARRKKKTRRLIFVFLLFVFALSLSVYLIKHYELKRNDVFSSVSVVRKVFEPKKDPAELKQTIEGIIAKYPNTDISVGFSDQDTEQVMTMGKDQPFTAASTAKVLVAVDFLHQVEQGKHSLNEKVAGVNARWQLRQMIQQSNNDSWMAFNKLLGYNQEITFAKSIGINSYNSIDNTIKVSDHVLLLKKLYNRELLNEENTTLLFYYMQNTNNEDMIPAALPDLTVMHKYGNLNSYLHDIAIVEGKNTFFIGIFTGSSSGINYDKRIALIKEIAVAANNYEQK